MITLFLSSIVEFNNSLSWRSNHGLKFPTRFEEPRNHKDWKSTCTLTGTTTYTSNWLTYELDFMVPISRGTNRNQFENVILHFSLGVELKGKMWFLFTSKRVVQEPTSPKMKMKIKMGGSNEVKIVVLFLSLSVELKGKMNVDSCWDGWLLQQNRKCVWH